MVSRDNGHLGQFEIALKDWTDERFVSREQIRALSMFNMYLVNLSEEDGWQYDGHSWKQGNPIGCLVVKATMDGAPVVVFTSARTTINGVVIFLRKLEQGLLEWRPDKYRQ